MIKKHLKLRPGIALLIDIITTIVSFFFVFPIRLGIYKILSIDSKFDFSLHLQLLLPIVIIWAIVLQIQNKSPNTHYFSIRNEIHYVIITVIWSHILLLMLLYAFQVNGISRIFICIFCIVNMTFLIVDKYLFIIMINFLREKGFNRKSVLIISNGKNSKPLIDSIQKFSDWGLDIIGILDDNGYPIGSKIHGIQKIGRFSDLNFVLENYTFDEAIFALPLAELERVKNLLIQCENEGVQTRIISEFFSGFISRTEVELTRDIPIITYRMIPNKELQYFIKRILDIIISLLAIAILSPLYLVIAIAIKLTSSGPVFYQWNVVGLNKKKFRSFKFRTMVVDADKMKEHLKDKNEMSGPVFKIKNDPRITKVGRFLRKYSLDELPQLFTVLLGEMSLVGPRPAGPHELVEYKDWHRRKLSTKPGMTCLWQVEGRNNISNFDDWVKLDLEYIDNWSVGLDLKILFKTIPTVIRGTGS